MANFLHWANLANDRPPPVFQNLDRVFFKFFFNFCFWRQIFIIGPINLKLIPKIL